jgi:hypothetical protein
LALLSPGGVAFISTPNHGYLKTLALAVTGKMDAHFTASWDGGHIKFFSIAEVVGPGRSLFEGWNSVADEILNHKPEHACSGIDCREDEQGLEEDRKVVDQFRPASKFGT